MREVKSTFFLLEFFLSWDPDFSPSDPFFRLWKKKGVSKVYQGRVVRRSRGAWSFMAFFGLKKGRLPDARARESKLFYEGYHKTFWASRGPPCFFPFFFFFFLGEENLFGECFTTALGVQDRESYCSMLKLIATCYFSIGFFRMDDCS